MGQKQSQLNRTIGSSEPNENSRLLPDVEDNFNDRGDGCYTSNEICPPGPHAHLPVYETIHRIRRDVIEMIDDPYSLEQLRDPRINTTIVRPFVDKLYELNDVSIVYCLLVNRTQFLREQSALPHQQSVCVTRAILCEIVANRILRRYHEDDPGPKGLLLLSQILVGGFYPFQGAPKEVLEENSHFVWVMKAESAHKRKLPALEIAIISESKLFLSSSACQRVVNAIYEGRVVYTPTTFMDILPDHYKYKPISLYDPDSAPPLDHYRLIVPRISNILEISRFIILLALYLSVMLDRDPSTFGASEIIFDVFAFGFALHQLASALGHGWHVYTQNLWAFLDVAFSVIFGIYFALRMRGLRTGQEQIAQQALDVLAMAAPVLIPRLAFNFMSEHLLFLSLRAMMKDFMILTALACWCFLGFLMSMAILSQGSYTPITIAKWMLWVWFGLDGTGVEKSAELHRLLGPILMIAFAFLGNTLFLTILVSMLSTTFSAIVSNATAEIQFRRAVLTLEGVKSDSIFSYQPPFNIIALVFLLPLKFVVSPRWFHKINVAAVRTLNAPILLLIGYIERRTLWPNTTGRIEHLPKSHSRANLWDFSRGFSVHADIQAVFDSEPPQSFEAQIENDDDVVQNDVENEFDDAFAAENTKNKKIKKLSDKYKNRRDSVAPFSGFNKQVRELLDDMESDDEDGDDVKNRLVALEKSTFRIEAMMKKLLENMDNGSGKAESSTERS
ncbi:hypothetical protein F5884DRAFT_666302 [Xylogone sp. PMI_703]|nr:hypothetical protein F5884DRAFT_666302 [Xylogone sp. PMI_703]